MSDTETVEVVVSFDRGTMPKNVYEAGKAQFKAAALICDEKAVQTVYTLDGKTSIDTSFEDVKGAVMYMAWVHEVTDAVAQRKE